MTAVSESELDRKSEPAERKSLLDRFVGETAIVALTTGILFLLGYLFLDGWLDVFDVTTWMIDFPSYTPLVFSFIPVMTGTLRGVYGLYAVLFLVLLINLFPKVRNWAMGVRKEILPKSFNAVWRPFAFGALWVIIIFCHGLLGKQSRQEIREI